MCSNCHKRIDLNPGKYTTDWLQEVKERHERTATSYQKPITSAQIQELLSNSERYWNRIDQAKLQRPMALEFDSSASILELFDSLVQELGRIGEFAEILRKSNTPSRLKSDLLQICTSLDWSTERLDTLNFHSTPFGCKDWEIHNIGIPNSLKRLTVGVHQTRVRTLELLLTLDPSNKDWEIELSRARGQFELVAESAVSHD